MVAKRKDKILVLVEDNDQSKTAVKFACRLGSSVSSPVEFVHVVDTAEFTSLLGVGDAIVADRMQEGEKFLLRLAGMAQKYSGLTPSVYLEKGLASDVIKEVLEKDETISMLVIPKASAKEGKDEYSAKLAEELVEDLSIPVIFVPGNMTNTQIEQLTLSE